MNFIDLKKQYDLYSDDINRSISRVIKSGNFILGDEVKKLEDELSSFCDAKYCIGVANGTDAIQLSLMALNLKEEDEVIVPSHTWISTATAAAVLGLNIRFVDINLETFNICTKDLEKKITPKTKVIIAVSLYGQCADFDSINEIARKKNIVVIEDAAQSFGAKYHEKFSCNLSDIATTSFFPTKPLGCYGDGGAVFTNNDEIAEKVRMISRHGQKTRHHHEILGINSRLDAIQAAILRVKLKYFPDEIKLRQKVASTYNQLILDRLDNISPPMVYENNESVYAQYVIKVPRREHIINELKKEGIPTQIYYPKPIHEQPIFNQHKSVDLPNTLNVKDVGLALPFYPYISIEEQSRVIDALAKAIIE